MKITLIKPSLALACTLLTTCSTENSNDGVASLPSNATSITQSNSISLISDTTRIISNTLDSIDTAGQLFFKPSTIISGRRTHFSDIAQSIARRSKAPSHISRNASTMENTQNCDSGTVRVRRTFTQTESSDIGEGDMNFNNCSYNNIRINGHVSFSYSKTFEASANITGAGIDLANLSITINDIETTISNWRMDWSYDDSLQIEIESTRLSFSSALTGGLLIETTSPWKTRYDDSYSFEGSSLVSGANNSWMQISAIDETQFRLELDENGNGTSDTDNVYEWTTIDSL